MLVKHEEATKVHDVYLFSFAGFPRRVRDREAEHVRELRQQLAHEGRLAHAGGATNDQGPDRVLRGCHLRAG